MWLACRKLTLFLICHNRKDTNKLSGKIPSELAQVPALQYIQLGKYSLKDNNFFAFIRVGTIFSESNSQLVL